MTTLWVRYYNNSHFTAGTTEAQRPWSGCVGGSHLGLGFGPARGVSEYLFLTWCAAKLLLQTGLLVDPVRTASHLVDGGDHGGRGKVQGGSGASCDNPSSDHRLGSLPHPPPSPGSIVWLEKPAEHHCLSASTPIGPSLLFVTKGDYLWGCHSAELGGSQAALAVVLLLSLAGPGGADLSIHWQGLVPQGGKWWGELALWALGSTSLTWSQC